MFGIFKVYSDAKKGVRDPAGLGKDLALDLVKGPLVLFTFLGGLFLAVMCIIGFTGLLGGPYLFFKVVFWLMTIPFIIFQLVGWTLYRKLEQLVEKTRQRVHEKIVEGRVE